MKKARPFIKWVGGKSQLIEQLEAQLPADFDNWEYVTYIEPFVGGGAMLFYMLQRYPNINHAIINDINSDLATCYRTVRDTPEQLISSLKDIEKAYLALETEDGRKDFFMAVRERYNEKNLDGILDDLRKFGTVTIDRDMVIICVVGDLEWQNRGYESKVMTALKDIPVRMISFGGSNYNISFLVRKEDKVAALKSLSKELF